MLRERVESLLESTIRQTVVDVAKETYVAMYGRPLLDLLKSTSYTRVLENCILDEAKKAAILLVQESPEFQEALREQVRCALEAVFEKK